MFMDNENNYNGEYWLEILLFTCKYDQPMRAKLTIPQKSNPITLKNNTLEFGKVNCEKSMSVILHIVKYTYK